jgi:elongation factor Ts
MFRRLFCVAQRRASTTTTSPKVPLALVAELRKKTQVSINKAREALTHSNGDIAGALEWLQNDLVTTGASKAAKVACRDAKEGLIGISVLSQGAGFTTAGGVRAAMIELNCETDFVGRNELFARLAMDIAHTAAFISEAKNNDTQQEYPSFVPIPLEELKEAPLLSHTDPGVSPVGTVSSAIRETIVKVGENIILGRASAIVEETSIIPSPSTYNVCRLGSYVHGALHDLSCGRIGTLALINLRSEYLSQLVRQESFRKELAALERSIARQIVGFDTLSIRPSSQNEVEEQALYRQPFITMPGEINGLPVEEALQKWSTSHGLASAEGEGTCIDVVRFLKWKIGEAAY